MGKEILSINKSHVEAHTCRNYGNKAGMKNTCMSCMQATFKMPWEAIVLKVIAIGALLNTQSIIPGM